MRTFSLIVTILAISLLLSCGGPSMQNAKMDSSREMALSNADLPQSGAEEKITVSDDRKIIRTGEITFETGNPVATRESVIRTVKELGGYVVRENTYEYVDRTNYTLELRVPADKFDQLIEGVEKNSKRIDSKNISAQDVTEEYIDVEARLKTKKDLEERYRQLLSKANSVNDILSIERETGKLREEIESAEGRYRYLKDHVAFSSLTITFYEKISKPFGFGSKVGSALKFGWRNFLMFLTGLISLWPFLILIGAGIFAGVRITRARKKAKG